MKDWVLILMWICIIIANIAANINGYHIDKLTNQIDSLQNKVDSLQNAFEISVE